jgi:hypothetical protein
MQTKRKRKNLKRKYLYEKIPMNTHDKIRRLKQQAKHGSVWDDIVRVGSDVADVFASMTDVVSASTTAYVNYEKALLSFNTVNSNLISGFEKQMAVNKAIILG